MELVIADSIRINKLTDQCNLQTCRTRFAYYSKIFIQPTGCPAMTAFVKGCKMPASSRRPVSLHTYSTGRRLTSLEGGNRGMLARGHGRQSRYGDSSFDFSVRGDNVTHHRGVPVHYRASCIAVAPVFLFPVSAIERKSMPSTNRYPDRI